MSDAPTYDPKLVASQKEELFVLLSRIGLGSDYDIEIPIPDEDTPLAELFAAVKIAADNLKLLAEQRNAKIREAEENARTVKAQSAAIMELSTPVIQIVEGVLAMPLIGAVDTARARQITEHVLDEISRRQAGVVILDVTGVPIIDTAVAAHLIKTIQAARMLGAECVVTGISPENAQALVAVGVPLPEMRTRGTLQAGLEHALSITNRRIQKL